MRRSLMALIAVALSAAACASPPPVDPRHVSRFIELRPGVSMVAEATAIMGEPKSLAQFGNGSTSIVWMEWDGPSHLTTVGLLFDSAGKFVRMVTITKI